MIEITVCILTATWKKIKDATVVKNNSKAFTVFSIACTSTVTSEGIKRETYFASCKVYMFKFLCGCYVKLTMKNIPEAKFFKIAFRCLRNIEVVIPIRTKLRIINNTKKLKLKFRLLLKIM